MSTFGSTFPNGDVHKLGHAASDQRHIAISRAQNYIMARSRSELPLLAKRTLHSEEPILPTTSTQPWTYPTVRATNTERGTGLPIRRQPRSPTIRELLHPVRT